MPPDPRPPHEGTPAGVREAPAVYHVSGTPPGCAPLRKRDSEGVAALDARLISRNPAGLPNGWRWVTVSDLAAREPNSITDGPFGSKLKTEHYSDAGPRVVRLKNIGDAVFVDARAHISEQHFATLQKHRVFPGDLVIAALGENPPRACIIPESLGPAVVKADCIRLKTRADVSAKFVNYALNSEDTRRRAKMIVHGVGRPRLNLGEIKSIAIPLPPLDEQQRIVAEIEKQFTRLEAGVASLKRVQAALKRYRASVLKAACEGRLVPTEAELARRESRPYEPATTLLTRILKERRAIHERTQAHATRKKKYKEPAVAPVTAEELPEGWTWASWEQIAYSQNGRPFPSAEYQATGFKLLRPGNLHVSGKVVWTDENTRCLPQRFATENPDLLVGGRELVMNLTAQSLKDEFLGRVCITSADDDCLLNQRLARLTPVIVQPEFALYLLRAWRFRRYVDGLNSGSLIQHMFTSQLAEFTFPLPPLAEQHRIVAEVERCLSVIEELEATVTANLQRATRLRQAILHRAFSGQLVSSAPHLAVVEADPYVPGVTVSVPSLSAGAYTLPDAARLLQLPLARLRAWVRGSVISDGEGEGKERRLPAGKLAHRGEGRHRNIGFLTLIELFTIGQLRGYGVSMKTLREARDDLEKRYNTHYPFALHGIMTDGRTVIYNLGDQVLLELGKNGQTAFEKVLEQFCHRLEFDEVTKLVTRFYPAGKESAVVVDPRHSFGRPIIAGTNIATESIASLVRGGEKIDDLAADYGLNPEQVADAWNFENREAA